MTTRITGGSHRGRALRAPSVAGLRPTSERARAALFSIIGSDAVAGARVLDLYAGTGALGLDALSRGAARADFVERNGRLCAALSRTLRAWSLESRGKVWRGRALSVLDALPGGYDIALADPPYGSTELAEVVERLQSARLLNVGGLAALEHRAGAEADFAAGRFVHKTTKRYGDTAITVLTAGAADA